MVFLAPWGFYFAKDEMAAKLFLRAVVDRADRTGGAWSFLVGALPLLGGMWAPTMQPAAIRAART